MCILLRLIWINQNKSGIDTYIIWDTLVDKHPEKKDGVYMFTTKLTQASTSISASFLIKWHIWSNVLSKRCHGVELTILVFYIDISLTETYFADLNKNNERSAIMYLANLTCGSHLTINAFLTTRWLTQFSTFMKITG